MSDRKVEFFIVDIFIAIDKIKRYSSKFTNGEDLLHSELEWDGVIRYNKTKKDRSNRCYKMC